ncbi:MAG: exodeoxyribonuclease V subunit alpha [Nitriliruptoraceae bacterium]
MTDRDARAGTALAPFVAGGVFTPADVRLAERLGRIAGDDDPAVLLGAALALRGPRYGHVCVDLDRVAEHVAIEPRLPGGGEHDHRAAEEVDELPWPSLSGWQATLLGSPLVRTSSRGATPLVLDGHRLYLDRYWRYEEDLATALHHRATAWSAPTAPSAAELVAWLDELFGPVDALDRQRLAAAVGLTRGLTVIAGGPGTGKTYTVARVLALLHRAALAATEERPLRVALVAPTGKAAARLQESLREALGTLHLAAGVRDAMERTPASTIHRLLGVSRGSRTRFRHDARHPLPHDVVIVDEASMVSLPLMAKLVDAVRDDARLILLGDRDQLASVEAGAAFGDICGPDGSRPTLRLSRGVAAGLDAAMGGQLVGAHEVAEQPGIWDAIVRLDRFRRFSSGSSLAAVAAAIQAADTDVDRVLELLEPSTGRPVPGGAVAGDPVVAGPDEPGVAGTEEAEAVAQLLDPGQRPDAADTALEVAVASYADVVRLALAEGATTRVLEGLARLRVLCARRRGGDGVAAWNRRIEARLAAEVEGFDPSRRWYLGRPILITENDHGLRLYNGDVGIVVEDARRPGTPVAAFWTADGGLRSLSPARLPACETTFAMTIHKSQGSQFEDVVVVLPPEPSPVLTRELIYTAVTRARRRAVLVGTSAVLRAALDRPVQRASGLQERLWRLPSEAPPAPGEGSEATVGLTTVRSSGDYPG